MTRREEAAALPSAPDCLATGPPLIDAFQFRPANPAGATH
ncbi:hypothetical protein LMG26691_03482 [Achromobacter animicus]|nr:hypothetical protein LMG26691_03482 [Achromobacter animicus]